MFNLLLMLLKILPFACVVLIIGCRKVPETDVPQYKSSAADSVLVSHLASLDVPLDPPRTGEWLSVHQEPGQTFRQYKLSQPVRTTTSRNVIYILPIGIFTPYQDSVITYTASYLETFFSLRVEVLDPLANDSIVSDGQRNGDEGRQLLTTTILDYLKKIMPKDAIVIMGLTATDLYGEQYNFVFGRAHIRDRVGVSSMARFAKAPLNSRNYVNCLERMIKTSSHEISHMFSLQHCIHAVCVMNGSNSLSESDSRPNRLCSECHRKLQWNVGFDVVERIEGLYVFFKKHDLVVDVAWMEKELVVINRKY